MEIYGLLGMVSPAVADIGYCPILVIFVRQIQVGIFRDTWQTSCAPF